MEPLSSGDNKLEIWDDGQGWIDISRAYLTEAAEYKLRYPGDTVKATFQEVPLPFYKQGEFLYVSLLTPFQSGSVKISVNGNEIESYVYPDHRKLTEEQYNIMVEEILEEANICFQLSGLETQVNTTGRSRIVSWSQWSYIERNFQQLRQLFSKIENRPIRRLQKQSTIMKRERVQRAEQTTLAWLDRKGHGRDIPTHLETNKTYETINLYENQVLKQQTLDLFKLLKNYESVETVSSKAKRYKSILQQWLNSPFLREINENSGPYNITQTFRKHPVYRLWYEWFDKLYKHRREGIGFSYPIALKDTFFLYEMWCYIQIIKILRESNLVRDTSHLFKTTREGLFLNLAENNQSSVELTDGMTLYFQRSYQYNTKTYHTFTQRMIPDIVLEGKEQIIVFDPKYRVAGNLGTALGEMHKYRDGIIHRESGQKAAREVYILTPTSDEQADGMRYFDAEFREKYGMGAVKMVPGGRNDELKHIVFTLFELI
ncbi:DUF2357 domain-containing protein [Bacillus sp. ISL-55]|uniref:DUF2357 domain-containing protein n=1 Tax=Bacillus sp. ISL-55 TaxID=2819134 RepID=UPI001BE822CC|nr:DUF2357 domain-containing protein [Bacillus sp. ISL-55]MBT2691777.1 DUF2357 domain-containing protein [Bacillus sp. ISL-55]